MHKFNSSQEIAVFSQYVATTCNNLRHASRVKTNCVIYPTAYIDLCSQRPFNDSSPKHFCCISPTLIARQRKQETNIKKNSNNIILSMRHSLVTIARVINLNCKNVLYVVTEVVLSKLIDKTLIARINKEHVQQVGHVNMGVNSGLG